MSQFDAWFRRRMTAMRIIALALPFGAINLMGIALFVRSGQIAPFDATSPFLFMAIGLFAATTILAFIVPAMFETRAMGQLAKEPESVLPEQLFSLRQTGMILRLALLESATFVSLIAYQLGGWPWTLGLALIGIVLMALEFPTEVGMLEWLGRAGERIGAIRNRSGEAERGKTGKVDESRPI